MIQTVVKRDGRIVGFNEEKIVTAIRKAMLHTDKGEDMQLIRQITDHISFKGEPQMTVEAIQDAVELELMASSRKDVAQKYIAYRNQRSVARKAKTRDMFLEIINIKSNDITRENANMNADTPAGMMMKFSSETTKPFVDDYLLSEEVKEAVSNNYLHIHDKDYYPTKSLTCVQHPLDRILKYGFSAGHGESRPAKRIETASILGCISLETAQNEMHGGQAIPAFDFYLAPYVRNSFIEEVKTLEDLYGQDFSHLYNKPIDDYQTQTLDGLSGDRRVIQHAINRTVSRVHQSMEAFIHNMNTIHSRGGNQVVFSSINYGTDTSAEGRCIIRELLKSTYRGVGNGETAIFPIQIWKKKRGVSYLPEDRNYDLYQLACKVTARRFFPNFLNLDATFNQSEDWKEDDPQRYIHEVATMGCRPHEVICPAVPEHERPLGVIRGGDLLVEGAVVEGHDTQQIRRQAYHVAVPPAAVVHVVAAVVVAEDELVDGLGPVDDAVDERLAQRIAERPGRGVGHGYADAAGFTLMDVVAGEEKVILAVGMNGRGRPHGAFHPLHLVVGDDPGVLLPVYEVFRREGV